MKILLPFFVCAASLAVAPFASASDYLPLQTGNRWVYRAANGVNITISVGLPAFIGNNVYHRVTGYAHQPYWVRRTLEGTLVALDEETNREFQLNGFLAVTGGRHESRLTPCESLGQPQLQPVEYQGPAGRFPAGLIIRYITLNCADTGILSEIYLANVGLLQRVVQTFFGPHTFDLIEARVGNLVLLPEPSVSVRLSLPTPTVERVYGSDPVLLRTRLRVSPSGVEPLTLQFPTSQRYDFAVRNAAGQTVFSWSSNKAFLQVAGTETIGGDRIFAIEEQLQGLPDGLYTVEGWLTTAGDRKLASAAPLRIRSQAPLR